MPCTFDVCIDEAGDEGFAFHKDGCTRWFVLSAVVCVAQNISLLDETLKDLKSEINWKQRKPLHFRDLKAAKRRTALERMTHDRRVYRAVTVMVHKPSLTDPETFQEKNRLYFYFTRYLLERVSWLCRDAAVSRKREFGDGTAKIVFSHRTDLSYVELRNYFEILKTRDTRIDWDVIKPKNFLSMSSGKHSGLQVADAVASAFYCADHHCANNRSSEWAEMFKPLMYKRNGKYRGYGVKIFPAEAEKKIAQNDLASWANSVFPA